MDAKMFIMVKLMATASSLGLMTLEEFILSIDHLEDKNTHGYNSLQTLFDNLLN